MIDSQQRRFRPESVSFDSNEPFVEPRAFVPLPGTDKDRFGNRFLGSGVLSTPEKGYVNKDQGYERAGFLISPIGQMLLKKHPNLLTKLDRAFISNERTLAVGEFRQIDPDVQFRFCGTGSQSDIYDFKIGEEHYIGKVQQRLGISVHDGNQSYINEMLQIQTLEAELGDKLAQSSFRLPKIYFATGQVMLREFVEGEILSKKDVDFTFRSRLSILLDDFLEKMKKENPALWKNVIIDLYRPNDSFGVKENQFIKTRSGEKVIIDPFYYSENSN